MSQRKISQRCRKDNCQNKATNVLFGVFRFPMPLCDYHLKPYSSNLNSKIIPFEKYAKGEIKIKCPECKDDGIVYEYAENCFKCVVCDQNFELR
jgi:hypothetical protein